MPDVRSPRDPRTADLLCGGLSLRVARWTTQIRAELLQQVPGGPPAGTLVWQRHRSLGDGEDAPSLLLPAVLSSTARWLDRAGWPGVDFDHL